MYILFTNNLVYRIYVFLLVTGSRHKMRHDHSGESTFFTCSGKSDTHVGAWMVFDICDTQIKLLLSLSADNAYYYFFPSVLCTPLRSR